MVRCGCYSLERRREPHSHSVNLFGVSYGRLQVEEPAAHNQTTILFDYARHPGFSITSFSKLLEEQRGGTHDNAPRLSLIWKKSKLRFSTSIHWVLF
jgi:hypothetical protein